MASLVGGLMEDGLVVVFVYFLLFSFLLFSQCDGGRGGWWGERHTAERHVDGGDVCG